MTMQTIFTIIAIDFGYGEDRDGALLLISMEDNDWYISTCGYGITVFTDAGIQYIGEQIKEDLSDGDFSEAFDKFVGLCDDFITKARTGDPYDSHNLPKEPLASLNITESRDLFLYKTFTRTAKPKNNSSSGSSTHTSSSGSTHGGGGGKF